jgi:hypothetical protein
MALDVSQPLVVRISDYAVRANNPLRFFVNRAGLDVRPVKPVAFDGHHHIGLITTPGGLQRTIFFDRDGNLEPDGWLLGKVEVDMDQEVT